MPPVGFEPTVAAGERPQTYVLDRAATGTGSISSSSNNKKSKMFLCKFQPYPPSSYLFAFFVFQTDPLVTESFNLLLV